MLVRMMNHVTVEVVTGMSDAVSALATRTPFKPHRWLRPDAPDMLAALVRHRLQQGIAATGSQAWSASTGPDVRAVAVLHALEWDSKMLGMPAGRIELVAAGGYVERRSALAALLRAALPAAEAAGIHHVSVRVDAGDDAAIHELEGHGFLTVDTLVTFGLLLDRAAPRPGGSTGPVRPASAADAPEVGRIAAEAFRDGRFHADPDISEDAARRVYRSWAIACCEGAAADAVLVATGPAGVEGFVACRMQRDTAVHLQRPAGTIVLIATAAGARGSGTGMHLMVAATAWFMERNAVAVEVGTQLRNVTAARLYERAGFRIVSGALSLRLTVEK